MRLRCLANVAKPRSRPAKTAEGSKVCRAENMRRRRGFPTHSIVILSAAKDPLGRHALRPPEWILRCAQDDGRVMNHMGRLAFPLAQTPVLHLTPPRFPCTRSAMSSV